MQVRALSATPVSSIQYRNLHIHLATPETAAPKESTLRTERTELRTVAHCRVCNVQDQPLHRAVPACYE